MIVISSTKLAKSLDGRAGAGLPSIIQRWPGRNSHEILPGLFLNWIIAGAAFATRQLPGMAMFNPMMLSMAIGIALHAGRRPSIALLAMGFVGRRSGRRSNTKQSVGFIRSIRRRAHHLHGNGSLRI
jgi:hypothetical protein